MVFLAWALNLSLFFGSVIMALHCRVLCGIFFAFMLLAIFSAILLSLKTGNKRVYTLNPREKSYEIGKNYRPERDQKAMDDDEGGI